MRGPYGKLLNEFFPSFYGPSAKRASHENKEGKKWGSITCCTDRANEDNKMFIIWFRWLFRFWKGDQELEVRTATYGPGIDQSQHAKSFSHIILSSIARGCFNIYSLLRKRKSKMLNGERRELYSLSYPRRPPHLYRTKNYTDLFFIALKQSLLIRKKAF